jgi:hypothetical protein
MKSIFVCFTDGLEVVGCASRGRLELEVALMGA